MGGGGGGLIVFESFDTDGVDCKHTYDEILSMFMNDCRAILRHNINTNNVWIESINKIYANESDMSMTFYVTIGSTGETRQIRVAPNDIGWYNPSA